MSKLYFKYGAMGSSKTAQALMTRFNYMQKGYEVLLIKPMLDTRDILDGEIIVKSRVGISAKCTPFDKDTNLFNLVEDCGFLKDKCVVIVDEAQFCTAEQIDQLHEVTNYVPVLCYGLLTNFKTKLFEGSQRLIEVAESISEIKSVCECGNKATVNARFINEELALDGAEILIGAEETYKSMCYRCYERLKNKKLNSEHEI